MGQWSLSECQTKYFEEKKIADFCKRVCVLLEKDKKYTSQELFVIFHTALLVKSEEEIENMIIYWEPHFMPRELMEKCVLWLGTAEVPCDIINIVRNGYITRGSRIKGVLKLNWAPAHTSLYTAVASTDIEKEEYEGSKRLIVRFEDLKCRPKEELDSICQEWEIPWSDSLMETTICGEKGYYDNGSKQVHDFDLEPVYNQYEEYFSAFDRFRITVLCAPWQKKYGYPFVDINLFSRRDLQEMFLKTIRLTDMIDFSQVFENQKKQIEFMVDFQNYIRQSIQNVWMLKVMEEKTADKP